MKRGSMRLRTLGKKHKGLHTLLWQAREAYRTLKIASEAQKILFEDLAEWASSENRALNDVTNHLSDLSTLNKEVLTRTSLAFKAFRKDIGLILEGENRCDGIHKRLQNAENNKRKLRCQMLKIKSKRQQTGDLNAAPGSLDAIQAQVVEAERTADRAHMEACEASREQESIKLIVLKSALSKVFDTSIDASYKMETIFRGCKEVSKLIPDPPPPGDSLSNVRYTSYNSSKRIVERVQREVSTNSWGAVSPSSVFGPVASSTPNCSTQSWEHQQPSAPLQESLNSSYCRSNRFDDPPPPYNVNVISTSTRSASNPETYPTLRYQNIASPATSPDSTHI